MSRVIDLLIECEKWIDALNAKNPFDGSYCIYCKSKIHDGNVGIVHITDCLIVKLRKEIKMQEEKKRILSRLELIDL